MTQSASTNVAAGKRRRPIELSEAILALRANRSRLEELGVIHAGIFGSVARGEARADSDLDVLVDLDHARIRSIYDYSGVRLAISDLFDGGADVVARDSLRPRLKERIVAEVVDAF